MFVIIVSPQDGSQPFAHPVVPRVWVDARSIATELSRDFRDANVTARTLDGGHVYWFQNGHQTR